MDNQDSKAIPKIPRLIENADFEPESVGVEEGTSMILEYGFSSEQWRRLTAIVNEKVKNLNWELEKFKVNLLSFSFFEKGCQILSSENLHQ